MCTLHAPSTAPKLTRPSPHPKSACTSLDAASTTSNIRLITISGQGTHGDNEANDKYSCASRRLPLVSLGVKGVDDDDDDDMLLLLIVDTSSGICWLVILLSRDAVLLPRRRRLRNG